MSEKRVESDARATTHQVEPKGGNPLADASQGGGQQSSKERGTSTHTKKNPGKRPHQGGSSA